MKPASMSFARVRPATSGTLRLSVPSNYFTDARIAQRYATSRRSYHAAVADQIRALCGLNAPATISVALDAGCGTGLSALALTAIADKVIGCDASSAMLGYAAPHDRVEYRLASAEHSPIEDGSVDLVTAGSAYHWFDQDLFLAEASRILRTRGLRRLVCRHARQFSFHPVVFRSSFSSIPASAARQTVPELRRHR